MLNFKQSKMAPSLLLKGEVIGRDDRIWTRDILYPKQTRYQAALHPFRLVYNVIVENLCLVFHTLISSMWYTKMIFPFPLFGLISYNNHIMNNKWIFLAGILRWKGTYFAVLRKGKSYLSNHCNCNFNFELGIPRTNIQIQVVFNHTYMWLYMYMYYHNVIR